MLVGLEEMLKIRGFADRKERFLLMSLLLAMKLKCNGERIREDETAISFLAL